MVTGKFFSSLKSGMQKQRGGDRNLEINSKPIEKQARKIVGKAKQFRNLLLLLNWAGVPNISNFQCRTRINNKIPKKQFYGTRAHLES